MREMRNKTKNFYNYYIKLKIRRIALNIEKSEKQSLELRVNLELYLR